MTINRDTCDRALVAGGIAGAILTTICCATPLLSLLFGAMGLAAWLFDAEFLVIPALVLCVALAVLRLLRMHLHGRNRIHEIANDP